MKKLITLSAVVAVAATLCYVAAPLQAQLLAGCGLVGMTVAGFGLRGHQNHAATVHAADMIGDDFFDSGVHMLVRRAG